MKTAYIFPGQGAQFEGMGKDLYQDYELARDLFDQADEILGFSITELMFNGTAEELKQTKVTQPAIFLHSVIKVRLAGDDFKPDAVAGHSLGEFSALVASGALGFGDGLKLVSKRAMAMQKACEKEAGTMAAILGLEDPLVEEVCESIGDIVIPANYNCPGQLVISGSVKGIEKAVEILKEKGARRALVLPVGGAFHSPLMDPAREELRAAIDLVEFSKPVCPIYQNIDAEPTIHPDIIRTKLVGQLTSPVKWSQTIFKMINDGVGKFIESGGTGKVLSGMVKKIDRGLITEAI